MKSTLFILFILADFYTYAQSSASRKYVHHDSIKFKAPKIRPEDTVNVPPPVEYKYPGKVDSTKQGDEETPKTYVEQMPEYPGGSDSMYRFIKAHLQYPQVEKEAGIEETVFMRFVIDTSGMVGRIEVMKGRNKDFINAATTCLKSMPKWIPGRMNGVLVSVFFTLPFRFRLN